MNAPIRSTNGILARTAPVNSIPLWKRGFDLTGAFIGLVLLSPLMILIAVYIRLASRGPVLFKHKRYGYQGNELLVWKFRSMHVNVDPEVHQQHVINKVHDDQHMNKMDTESQLIPLGKWLRSTSMDELPQLFNVIKGEMSLVGPRPDVVPKEEYQDWQQQRFEVLPGLTGLWQVSGKNQTTFIEMNELDVTYVNNRSLWMDLRIVILTVPAILKQVAEELFHKRDSE